MLDIKKEKYNGGRDKVEKVDKLEKVEEKDKKIDNKMI